MQTMEAQKIPRGSVKITLPRGRYTLLIKSKPSEPGAVGNKKQNYKPRRAANQRPIVIFNNPENG